MHQYEHKKLGKFNETCKADKFFLKRTNVSTKSKGKIKETYKAEEFHWNRTYVSAKGHKNEENHARML